MTPKTDLTINEEFSGKVRPFLWAALRRHWVMFVIFLSSSLFFAASEGLSITLIIPILETSGGIGDISGLPIISSMMAPLRALEPSDRLIVITIALIAAVLVRGVMQFLSVYFSSRIYVRLLIDYTKFGYDNLLAANLWNMPGCDSGSIQISLREHTQRMGTVVQGISQLLMAIVLLSFYGGLMLLISWQMTVASLVFVVVVHFLLKKVSQPWFYWAGERLSQSIQKIQRNIFETVSGMMLIKLRSAEDLMKRRFHDDAEGFYEIELKRYKYMSLQGPVIMTASGLFIAFLLLFISLLYADSREVWAPTFIYFVICLSRLIGPGQQIVTSQSMISINLHSIVEFGKFIEKARNSILPSGSLAYRGLTGGIELRDVTMTYDSERGPAVSRIDLHIKKNQVVALVGPSGAGKSTILSLLMRLRDPDSGQVLVDGVDLRDFEISSWRRKIAIVSQSLVFFNDTVRHNLTFGLHDVSDDQIRQALTVSKALEFVDELPNGMDSMLGEAAQSLSGGQRQRLAIARAIIADPEILILDEATNQLDSVTEKLIQDMIEQWSRDKTVVVVAHRLSTTRHADQVYVLNDGHVAASGRHEDLFRSNRLYKEMFETQQLGVA